MNSYKAHLFICTNSPDASKLNPSQKKCGLQNSENLRRTCKETLGKIFDKSSVRVSSSGCLGQCDRGIAAVIYPEGKWLLDLNSDSSGEIIEAVKSSVEKYK